MYKSVVTTLAAIALPLAVTFPALAQQASTRPQQPPPAASQGIQLTRDQIIQLQQGLNDNGFDAGPVDGVFGAQTIAALKRFQSKAGLQPTGQIDQQTLALVGIQPPAPTTGQDGSAAPASPAPQAPAPPKRD